MTETPTITLSPTPVEWKCTKCGGGPVWPNCWTFESGKIYHPGCAPTQPPPPPEIALRARIKELEEPFRNADEKDWQHLDLLLGQSGHGKFWRAVFAELRAALAQEQANG